MGPRGAFQLRSERYDDWTLIGKGGAAEVFKVHDRELGIPLAIKILKQELCGDARQVAALRHEVFL